ncbi:MAG: YkgJ family cysteine cluster protein [Ruminococcus sp.]|nr:YkgJ family cysteine cluster protein [Ruminococcus sp.]
MCRNLDTDTNLCTIYENRPLICNVDKMYRLYFSDTYTLSDFYEANHKACDALRQRLKRGT